MKHLIIYKNKDRYSSFPLLKQLDDRILIGFFTAPVPDHMGLFKWNVLVSFDEGITWGFAGIHDYEDWDWPANSPRERSDMFTCSLGKSKIATGSYGFKARQISTSTSSASGPLTDKSQITKSTSLFHRWSPDNWQETIYQRFYEVPGVDIIVTFPRFLEFLNIILIPAYAILSDYDDISRCFVWRSDDHGKTFRLWNMFPDGIDGNEMAFIRTKDERILAHIRSDNHPYLMESWSYDYGLTWTYPTHVYSEAVGNIIGGPPHLLRLKDNRILCSYGYRRQPMGIRAIISEDEGETWQAPIILRDDAGYASSLHKEKWLWSKFRFSKPNPAMDCGYPVSIQLEDESILTAYYITCEDRITGIEATKWKV